MRRSVGSFVVDPLALFQHCEQIFTIIILISPHHLNNRQSVSALLLQNALHQIDNKIFISHYARNFDMVLRTTAEINFAVQRQFIIVQHTDEYVKQALLTPSRKLFNMPGCTQYCG
ncbi:hypothetical protein T4D_2149 [Trichinella pseudospiralis]|uniref:Uncharacterized protein n=1 Tax=Trichinella pseudospiralis TaxID=6337 RepID=A0A0V1FV97_TRIPS|nr:hypothetical protein T4D_2149 [Trichinella pseudospiralis]